MAAIVPEDERKKASSKVDSYMRRWGSKRESAGRQPQEDCTGSRISANCNPTDARHDWIAWPKESQDLQTMQPEFDRGLKPKRALSCSSRPDDADWPVAGHLAFSARE